MDKLMEIITFALTFALRSILRGIAVWVFLTTLVSMKLASGAIAFPQCLVLGAAIASLDVNASFSEKTTL